jgi:hypothetical protein
MRPARLVLSTPRVLLAWRIECEPPVSVPPCVAKPLCHPVFSRRRRRRPAECVRRDYPRARGLARAPTPWRCSSRRQQQPA